MPGRSIDKTIRIAAPVDAVWRALSEGQELERWFPLRADVTPGVGGRIWLSWGPGVEAATPIEVWEPNRHLRAADEYPTGPDTPPVRVAMDFYIEADAGGTTVVRLVHSGFQEGAEWDDQYEAMNGGWSYFLLNLKHYLERHRGTPRTMVWERRPLTRPRGAVWDALLAALGEPPALPIGKAGTGEVVFARGPGHLALKLPDLADSLLFIELELGGERWHLGVWLSTYGLPAERTGALQRALGPWLDEVVGPAAVPG